jgi:type IV pilus assembly protein PilA
VKRNNKGFTLIELLIVVAIIGIIVAIAIPNLLNAIQRAKQRRSMGDERSIATAIEAYGVDFNRYPVAAGFTLPSGISYGGNTISASLGNYVSPTYIRVCPTADGWNSWFLVSVNSLGQDYLLISAGKDGLATTAPSSWGPTTNFNDDIVFSNGVFVNYPEGVQN